MNFNLDQRISETMEARGVGEELSWEGLIKRLDHIGGAKELSCSGKLFSMNSEPKKRILFLQKLSKIHCRMRQIWEKVPELVSEAQETLELGNAFWGRELPDGASFFGSGLIPSDVMMKPANLIRLPTFNLDKDNLIPASRHLESTRRRRENTC